METEGIRRGAGKGDTQRPVGLCQRDIKSSGLLHDDAQNRDQRWEIGKTDSSGFSCKMPSKTACVGRE